MDRRHQDIKTDSLIIAGILLAMGWYASPWQPIDTLFTQMLSRLGLEPIWSAFFLISGMAKLASAVCVGKCHPLLAFAANWLTVMVTLWTGFLFIAGPFTPTIAACWVIGIGTLFGMYQTARKNQKVRYVLHADLG